MYFDFLLVQLKTDYLRFKTKEKKELGISIPLLLSKEKHAFLPFVYCKMFWSLMVTGCTFSEYYNLNFYNRRISNQKTFLTSGSNLRAYAKLNSREFYHIYINKNEFNDVYKNFIGREWCEMSDQSKVFSLFRKYDEIIIKPKDGHSGSGITIIHECKKIKDEELLRLMTLYSDSIAEQVLHNHPTIGVLNQSSLNTMRIITVGNGVNAKILYAGIRFGAKGSLVDNISQGGFIASIDVETGKINSVPHTKKFVNDDACNDFSDIIGFQIPNWNGLISFISELTSVVPQMKYMAWDIALTENGFVAIEGNHSSGNTISQAHINYNDTGLKVILDNLIEKSEFQNDISN